MGLVIPDTGLLFWMIISFSILFWLLAKYAWKPIMKSIRDRENRIESSLNAVNEAKLEIEKVKEENKKIMAEAKTEREQMLLDAKEIKDKMIRQAEAESKERANKIIEESLLQIENEKQKAMSELKSTVADLTIQISEKILQKELENKDKQKEYIDQLVNNYKTN